MHKNKIVRMLVTLISIFAIIYELVITLNYLSNFNIFTFIFWHVALVVFLFAICTIFYNLKYKVNLLLLVLIEVAFLGVFGAFISIIALILSFKESHYVEDFLPALREEVSDKKELNYTHVLHSSNLIQKAILTEPLADIMTYGSVGEQITALIRMNRYFKPEFTKFILAGLNSEENTIRVQSAAIITDIEQKTVMELNKILLVTDYNKKIEILLGFYEKFLNTGFLNYGRLGTITEKKISLLHDYFTTHERDLRSRIIYSQLLYEFNDIVNAKLILNLAMRKYSDFLSISESLKTMLLSMLYNLGEYEALRKTSQFIVSNSIKSKDEISDYLLFWASS